MTHDDRQTNRDEDEVDYRIFACDIIQNAGILLRLPQVALTTAQMLLQRFYHATDFTYAKCNLDITSMAALFLAAKIEEYPKRAREVISKFIDVISIKFERKISLDAGEHERVRKELIKAEKILLKTLGFNLLSSYPHKIVVNYYLAIARVLDPDENFWCKRDNDGVLQEAWNYCNDSLRSDVFIRYSKEVVACACIQMGLERYEGGKMLFPKSTDGRNWYCLFADEQEVLESIDIIRRLYNRKSVEPRSLRRLIYLANLKDERYKSR